MPPPTVNVHDQGLLRRFHAESDPFKKAEIADEVLPRLVTDRHVDEIRSVLTNLPETIANDVLDARMAAFRAILSALDGRSPDPFVAKAMERIDSLSVQDQATLYQRMAVAFVSANDRVRGEEYCAESLTLSQAIGDHKGAAFAACNLSIIAYQKGDYEAALYHAELTRVEATASENERLLSWVLSMECDMLAGFGRWDEARAVLRQIRGMRTEIKDNAYVNAYHDTEICILDGNLAGALQRVESIETEQVANRAQAMSLRALVLLSLGRDDDAKKAARQAYGLASVAKSTDRNVLGEFLVETRSNEAAILSSYVLLLAGDRHEGRRRLRTRIDHPGAIGVYAQTLYNADGREIRTPVTGLAIYQGYVDVIEAVRNIYEGIQRSRETFAGRLTRAELDVLARVADGSTNAEIAKYRKVSTSAVEQILTSAYHKLGIRRRHEVKERLEQLSLR